MPWTEITRPHYVREGLRYASDTTDAEWAPIAPWMPPPKRLGRKRKTKLRCVVDALLYILATGCQWRLLPKDFPPYSTVQTYFYRWRADGTLWRINHALVMAARATEDRETASECPLATQQVRLQGLAPGLQSGAEQTCCGQGKSVENDPKATSTLRAEICSVASVTVILNPKHRLPKSDRARVLPAIGWLWHTAAAA